MPPHPTAIDPASDANDPVSVIRREARAVALSFGVAAADDVASALIDRLRMVLGGDAMYLPKYRAASFRHREIRAKFTGDNAHELAREYGLTPRSVRRIIGKVDISAQKIA